MRSEFTTGILAVCVAGASVHGQTYRWARSFSGDVSPGPQAVAVYPPAPGEVPELVAGTSSSASCAVVRLHQGEWQPLGGQWPPYHSGAVSTLISAPWGGQQVLFAGGTFSGVGSISANMAAMWDGTSWTAIGGNLSLGSFDTGIVSLVVFNDGSGPALYAAGRFNVLPGSNRCFAKWNGGSWQALGNISGTERVTTMTVFDDGSGPSIYIGGQFTSIGGVSANNIARWTGSSFVPVGGGLTGTTQHVNALAVYDDGSGPKLYAGGKFTSAGGASANNLARWNGQAWSAAGATDSEVYALGVALNAGGQPALFAGGSFTSVGGQQTGGVGILDSSGWHSTGVNPTFGLGGTFVPFFDPLVGHSTTIACGATVKTSDSQMSGLCRWDSAGWSRIINGHGGGLGGEMRFIKTMDVGDGPRLYASAGTGGLGGTLIRGLAAWDGSQWSPVLQLTSNPGDVTVYAADVISDGVLKGVYIGGYIANYPYGGPDRHNVMKWDGTTWVSMGSGLGNFVFDLVGVPSGSLQGVYAGGSFTGYLARWNGSSWSTVGGGIQETRYSSGEVNSVVYFDDGSGPAIYAGGSFNTAGGAPALSVARWNGSSWSQVGAGLNNPVYKLRVVDLGDGPHLYAGGGFSLSGAASVRNVARWNGSAWQQFGTDLGGSVEELIEFNDGTGPALVAAGSFTVINGVALNGIARWNGNAWTPLDSGIAPDGGRVECMATFDFGTGPALYVSGYTYGAGGHPSFTLACWGAFCPADFNEDGYVNGDDFDSFSLAFFLGSPAADFDQNGFVNGEDFDGFALAFFGGC